MYVLIPLQLRGWDGWTPESIELHLQTRFAQLEAASALELYSEAFRTTEDIYSIMQLSKKTPKAKLMANYYDKLIGIFWVSENLLFHAFAWYKYYTLCREYNKSMTAEAKERQATCVLLAALAIPNLDWSKQSGNSGKSKTSKMGGAGALKSQNRSQHKSITSVQDEIAREKTSRMATLLGFQTHPTRSALLAELKSKGGLSELSPCLQQLYELVEHHTDPLTLVSKVVPVLRELQDKYGSPQTAPLTGAGEDGATAMGSQQSSMVDPARYIAPMQRIVLLKLMYNLSATYHTVSLTHLRTLTDGLGLSFEEVENMVVVAQRQNIIVKMDHLHNCLRFGGSGSNASSSWESSKELEFQTHLQTLARNLALVVEQHIAPTDPTPMMEKRVELFARVRSTIQEEHKATLMRKEEIERRKEEVERVAQEKLRVEAALKEQEEAARKAEESKRLAREQRLREKQKMLQIQEEMEQMEKEKYLKALGKEALQEFDEAELATMDAADLAKKHAQKANQKKEEAEQALKDKARRVDHVVRAIRMEEVPLVEARLEERRKSDRERYEIETAQKLKKAKETWESQVQWKETFSKFNVLDHMGDFEQLILQDRHAEHQVACKEADRVANEEARLEKRYRAQQRRKAEKQLLIDEEAARVAAEEEARKVEEAQLKEEERQRQHAAEVERMRQDRERRLDRESGGAPASNRDSGSGGSRWGDAGGSAEGGARGGGGASRYVPPSQRGADGGNGGGGSRFGGDRGYGGGRYEGRSGGDTHGGGGGRYGDRDAGGGGGGDRFGANSREDGPPQPARENSRWGR
jgi:translation initiation factor 3 subunit A